MRIVKLPYLLLVFCLLTINLTFGQDQITIERVSYNSSNRAYAPVYYKNGLVFCGVNPKNEALTFVDEKSKKQMDDIFFVPLKGVKVKKIQLFSTELKSSFHDGPITFSTDGNTAYFTRSQNINRKLKNRTASSNGFGVYKTTLKDGVWSDIEPCSFNSIEYNVGQPSLSANGKQLFVVSDKPGSQGGLDVYYSNIVGGVCGPLINLGTPINSEFNDVFPTIQGNGKLYFSSDRTSGYGGLDIYSSNNINNDWTTPVLMDTTVNSSFDDFGLVHNSTGNEGYFCSNRAGSDDIYKLNISYPEFSDCQELVNELLCYEFFEEATLNVDSVAMIYEWDFGDGHKERSLETYHCYEKSGFYTVELNIKDPFVGATFVNEATYELEIEEIIQPKVISLDTISSHELFTVEVLQGKWNAYEIHDYYIDYGDSTAIVKNDKKGHKYLEGGFKELKILISGQDKEQNTIQKNCFYKTVFVSSENTLITHQQEQQEFLEQLNYAGFNAEQLHVFDESFYSLELLSSKTSIKNNRKLLKGYVNKVQEFYDSTSNQYTYLLAKTNNPFDLIALFRLAHKDGFNNAVVKVFEAGKINTQNIDMLYSDLSGEVSVVLANVNFAFNGFELDEASKKELGQLITFLKKHPSNVVEIGAHTDGYRNIEKAKQSFKARNEVYTRQKHDKMSNKYNLKLSTKRANSVVKYMVSMGVNKKQVIPKGYGETNPIAPNFNKDGSDNSDGRTKNRRVAFKIIKQ